jgi:hypothetical protein
LITSKLKARGGSLDFAETLAKTDTEWNVSKVPQIYFSRVQKAIKTLARAGINSNLNNEGTWHSTTCHHQENSMRDTIRNTSLPQQKQKNKRNA